MSKIPSMTDSREIVEKSKESRKISEAQRKARNNWNNKQAQIAIRVKPDIKAQFDEHCKKRGESLVAFIVRACLSQIERDNYAKSLNIDDLLSD